MGRSIRLTPSPRGPKSAASNPTFQIFNRKYHLSYVIEKSAPYPLLIANESHLLTPAPEYPIPFFISDFSFFPRRPNSGKMVTP